MGWFNWLFSKTEVKNKFAVPDYDPEFHFRDKVKVINGFYKGQTGVVHDKWGSDSSYRVSFDGSDFKCEDIQNTDLQLIEDKKE